MEYASRQLYKHTTTYTDTHLDRPRQTDRQRQTETDRDRQIDRQTGIHAHIQTERHTGKQRIKRTRHEEGRRWLCKHLCDLNSFHNI